MNDFFAQRTGDSILWLPKWITRKFKNESDFAANRPYEVIEELGNLLLKIGANEILKLICSASGSRFDHAGAQLGVGDSGTAAVNTQIALQGTNTSWVNMDSEFPTYGSNEKATWQGTFRSTEGNFHWLEIAIRNVNGVLLNRKVVDKGTKTAGEIWQQAFEVSLA